jgi:hypothetical protein
MSAETLIAAHLRLAFIDLREACALADIQGRNAVYLAGQAAEQLVLAIAQSEGIQFERSKKHLLDHMIRALPDANPFKALLIKVSWLEAYATTYRYPTPSGRLPTPPSEAALSDVLRHIEDLLRQVADHFGVDGDSPEGRPAARSTPPRILK